MTCDLFRAARILVAILRSPDLKPARPQIAAALDPSGAARKQTVSDIIVDGLRKFIAHHTDPKGGTRPKASHANSYLKL